ncbi:hypothetical protein F504_3290 [Ralstonia pseudosolanacearum FQY_4]|nr:hypothetical protein F504_3290 [Ralstonia pseudosolanacearum FQY_4]
MTTVFFDPRFTRVHGTNVSNWTPPAGAGSDRVIGSPNIRPR